MCANNKSTNNSPQSPQYYIELANKFEHTDAEYASQSLQDALKILKTNPNKKQEFHILLKQASMALHQKKYPLSQEYLIKAKALRDLTSRKLLENSKANYDSSLDFNFFLADIKLFQLEAELMYAQEKYSESIYLLDEALELVEETGNNAALLYRLFNMKGVVHLKANAYESAVTSFLLAKHHVHTQIKSVKIRLYSDIALTYTRLNDNYSGIKYFNLTLGLLESEKSLMQPSQPVLESDELFPSKARVLLDISRSYKKAGAFKDALSYGSKALTVAEETNDEEFTLKALIHLSGIYNRLNSYESALELAIEALQIYQENEDLSGMASSYNAIGLIYNRLEEADKAKIYFDKVINLPTEAIQPKYYAAALRELALYHLSQEDYSQALTVNKKAFQLYEQLSNLKGKATVTRNSGFIYQAMGNNKLAIEAFTFAFEASQQTGDAWEQARNSTNLALLYAKVKPQQTQLWAKKSLRIAERIQAKPVMKRAYLALAIAEEKMKNYQQALAYTKLQASILAEINNDTVNMHSNDMHALKSLMDKMYQIEILEEELSKTSDKLFKQNSLLSELKNQTENDHTLIRNLQVIILILLCFVLFFIAKINKVIKV